MDRPKRVNCRICLKTMISDNLKKHMIQHDILSTYQIKHKCIYCNYQSDRSYNVRMHVEKKDMVECRICFKLVGSNYLNAHVKWVHTKKNQKRRLEEKYNINLHRM